MQGYSQSSANDPVTISPAGSYVPITTPVVETLLSTSFSPEGMVPSENRRLPDPMTRGKTHRRYWSTRLWRNSVWIRFPLPCTCSSGPSSFLSAAMPSAASPSIRTELRHSSVGWLRDVLGGVVECLGSGLLRGVRPVRGEDVVALASEKQVERPAHRLSHELLH